MRVIRRASQPTDEYAEPLLCLLYTNELIDADPTPIPLFLYALSLRLSLGINPGNIFVTPVDTIAGYCVYNNFIKQVALILDYGFVVSEHGHSLLMNYARTPDMVTLLIKYKQPAPVEALLIAVTKEWTSIVKDLLEYGDYSMTDIQFVIEETSLVCPVLKKLLLGLP